MSEVTSADSSSLKRLQAVNVLAVAAYTASTLYAIHTSYMWNLKDATLTPGLEFAYARILVVLPLLGFAGYQFNAQAQAPVRAIGYRLVALAVFSSLFNEAFDFSAYTQAIVHSLISAAISIDIVRVLRPLALDSPLDHALVRAPFYAWNAWSLVALGFAPSNIWSLGHPSAGFFVLCVVYITALTGVSVWYAFDGKRGGDVVGGAVLLWYAIELCCYHRVKSIMIAGIIASVISGLALVYTVVQSVRTAGQEGQIKLTDDAAEEEE